ncbi:MAG: SIMPL domain-containing protein [Bacillota bacterium]|nr:SIMPL domain-containing protein [Bacillota bacterium]
MSTKNIIIITALVLVVGLLVVGCGGNQLSTGTVEAPRVIQTYGEAELTAPPELAKISLAVETRSTVAEQAVEENARLATSVKEALLAFGLAEEDLVTGSYRLYSYREWMEGRPLGQEEQQTFQVVNEIIVSTNDLEAVGEIIDIAVRAGANSINYITFEIENPQELLMQALKAATEQAAKKAESIAEGAGARISGLHSVREERTDYLPFRFQSDMLKEEMAMGDGSTPITPDEVTVRAMVVAEYAF